MQSMESEIWEQSLLLHSQLIMAVSYLDRKTELVRGGCLKPSERHQSLRNICAPSLAPFGLGAQLCWIKDTPFLDLISFWKPLTCVLSEPAEPGALWYCGEQSSPAPDALAGYLRSPWHCAAWCQFYIYQWFMLPHGVTTTVKLALCGKTRHAE